MILPKILISLLIALSVVFIGLQVYQMENEAAGLRTLLFVLLTTLYYVRVKNKRVFFFSFLITFTIAEILNFLSFFVDVPQLNDSDTMYYLVNSVYIIAYALLITQILSAMNVIEMVKKYPFHLLILIVLDVFCVVVVTNTAIGRLTYYAYFVELIYNAVIMILLTVTLINYLHREDKKAINLLIGAIFIFFSEVLQLAYFYISSINILNVACSICLVLGFAFFYMQSILSYEWREEISYKDIAV
ncbi:hypothetical protein LX77_01863 [Gelidibacter algens]|uniref:YhhN-like protein n=1 Tax=Gelidibacter algens TaxID=49280 RepID=A0A327SA90_9FLAO|nr:hypothetical protein [Gelidibacter algens]RAJ24864.1 hypothetical protein LX77_01863 [Gelidibacter algens]